MVRDDRRETSRIEETRRVGVSIIRVETIVTVRDPDRTFMTKTPSFNLTPHVV